MPADLGPNTASPTLVFISHADEDKHIADQICATFEAAGFKCWIAPRDITAGQSWADAILRGIAASHVMVLIFSRYSARSPHVQREVERAV